MNKIISVMFLLGLASIVLAVQSDNSEITKEQVAAIEKEIMKVHAEMIKAAENSDAESLFSHVIDGCKGVIIQDGRILMTRQESLDATMQGLQGLKDISYKFNSKNITVISPTTAVWVADGTTSVTTLEDERQLSFQFAETIVFTLKDSQWKVFHAHRSVPNPR